jgi:hypothetical protein
MLGAATEIEPHDVSRVRVRVRRAREIRAVVAGEIQRLERVRECSTAFDRVTAHLGWKTAHEFHLDPWRPQCRPRP